MKILNSFYNTGDGALLNDCVDLEIICMPVTQKCQETFMTFFLVLVPHHFIKNC